MQTILRNNKNSQLVSYLFSRYDELVGACLIADKNRLSFKDTYNYTFSIEQC